MANITYGPHKFTSLDTVPGLHGKYALRTYVTDEVSTQVQKAAVNTNIMHVPGFSQTP
jgi:hypothetical protein